MKALKHSFGHGIWSKGGIERKWKSNMAKFPVEQFDSHDTAKVEASTPMLISGRVSSHCCWKSVLQSEKHKLPMLEKRLRTFQQKWALFHPSLAGTALLCSDGLNASSQDDPDYPPPIPDTWESATPWPRNLGSTQLLTTVPQSIL